eukprot:COSAG01_NODE_7008_length_3394_cov_3.696813_7_plen_102_part_00
MRWHQAGPPHARRVAAGAGDLRGQVRAHLTAAISLRRRARHLPQALRGVAIHGASIPPRYGAAWVPRGCSNRVKPFGFGTEPVTVPYSQHLDWAEKVFRLL